jgi:hypothetical protein
LLKLARGRKALHLDGLGTLLSMAFLMKVYSRAKMLKLFSPKENDLFGCFGRAQHHEKCSRNVNFQQKRERTHQRSQKEIPNAQFD